MESKKQNNEQPDIVRELQLLRAAIEEQTTILQILIDIVKANNN